MSNGSEETNVGETASNEGISVNFDVPLVPQPTDVSCWAASISMIISYRDQRCYTVEDVVAGVDMDTETSYGWNEIQNAVSFWQLNKAWPKSAMPNYWANLLQSNGPLWIVEVGNPYHAVVLIGINGDGTTEGTSVTVNNPWPPGEGAVENKSFLEFDNEFGLGAGSHAMIVHK